MRILKLLNKKYFTIIIIFMLSSLNVIAEDQPIDIWNIDQKAIETTSEDISSNEITGVTAESNIYNMQTDKKKNSIKLDQELASKEMKIVGLYDPADYGLSMDMWSNSDGQILKKLFKNIDNFDLSGDASEILNIALLTNTYYPNKNITEEEFLKFKSSWMIKESNLELIEQFLIKNQATNLHPELMKYVVDEYLSQSDVKKSCEIFSKIKEPLENEYLTKFNLYCLSNYGKNEEAQLILDLKKE